LRNGGIWVIDVRTPAEWESGHIEPAEHFPLSEMLDNRFPKANKDESLVVHCGSGYRSNIAASILKRAGFSRVKSLAGGTFAWSNAGFPLTP